MSKFPLCALIVAAVWLVPLCACDMGGAREPAVRPKALALPADTAQTLVIPRDKPFGLTHHTVNETTGAGGTADAEANVQATGAAHARTAAGDGGGATATFQLGHAFENDAATQAEVTVMADFELAAELSAAPDRGFPDGTLSLDLVVRNRRTRAVRSVTVVKVATDQGRVSIQRRDGCTLTLVVPPGDVLDIFLAGTTATATRENRAATASLDVRDLTLTLTAQPAPPVPVEEHAPAAPRP
jgi:hypothetical protein